MRPAPRVSRAIDELGISRPLACSLVNDSCIAFSSFDSGISTHALVSAAGACADSGSSIDSTTRAIGALNSEHAYDAVRKKIAMAAPIRAVILCSATLYICP
jgi:hypothetical protein